MTYKCKYCGEIVVGVGDCYACIQGELYRAKEEIDRLRAELKQARASALDWAARCGETQAQLERVVDLAGMEEHESLLIEVCQLLNGWSQDGSPWSEWDESVRMRLSSLMVDIRARIEELKK